MRLDRANTACSLEVACCKSDVTETPQGLYVIGEAGLEPALPSGRRHDDLMVASVYQFRHSPVGLEGPVQLKVGFEVRVQAPVLEHHTVSPQALDYLIVQGCFCPVEPE